MKLIQLFSRPRSMWYFNMWNQSDRQGFEKYLKFKVKHNLFLSDGVRTNVWYTKEGMNTFEKGYENITKETWQEMKKVLDYHWNYILPVLEKSKELQTMQEVIEFYNHYVEWWTPMTVAFDIPNYVKDKELCEDVEKYREQVEKYSSDTDTIVLDAIKSHYGEFADLLTVQELKSGITKEDAEKLSWRKKGYVMFDNEVYKPEELETELKKRDLELEEEEITEELIGATANSGKAKGKVKIIRSKEQFTKFENGDVVVTEMTSPEYIPILKNASALITDEGGITCHAAIVSRELNIPCIIGTKTATKYLKDNDLVEVDANTGVVKKLE